MATEPIQPTEDDEVSFKEMILSVKVWLKYLVSKWQFLLIVGILGGSLGFVYSLLKKPLFTATTTFVLEGSDGKGALSQYAGMAAMVGVDLSGGTSGLFQGDNILELYKSRTMIEQVLLSKTYPDSNELLIDRYINFNDLKAAWGTESELAMFNFQTSPTELSSQNLRMRDSIISLFVNEINGHVLNVKKPDKKLSIISVEITSPDEVFSKAFNENLVQRVNDFYIQTKTKRSSDNISILEAKVDSVRVVMAGAIYSAARVSDATPNLNPARQTQRIAPSQEAQFSAETNKAVLSQLLQNLELTKLNLLQEQPLIQIVDSPVYPLSVDHVGKLKAIFFGGFVSVLLIILALSVQRYYREIMKTE